MWTQDDDFDIEYHFRHSALPKPGRVRELLELCSRLHSTRLARERPLWEAHLIEGLQDGRVALYTKLHHSLVDGVSAMRLLQSVMSTDPDEREMPPMWAARPDKKTERVREEAEHSLAAVPLDAMRTALGITADAAGLPAALIKTLKHGLRNETSALSLYAPRTMFNTTITGSRRFAAQGWPIERLRAIGKASDTTLNDVVLAMCSGAIRSYLVEHDALPDSTLVSMVPVGLNAKQSQSASVEGGNAVGAVMVKLGTDLHDPAERLASIHSSMQTGKDALGSMTPLQIMAMSALGMAPSIVTPMLRLHGIIRPPFNLIISNVPGPRSHAVPQRRADDRHLPAVDPDQRDGAEHHLQQLRRRHGLRPHRLPPQRPPPPAPARPPRRRAGRAGEGGGGGVGGCKFPRATGETCTSPSMQQGGSAGFTGQPVKPTALTQPTRRPRRDRAGASTTSRASSSAATWSLTSRRTPDRGTSSASHRAARSSEDASFWPRSISEM